MVQQVIFTFRTYGTWLHGDARGSFDRRDHNRYGTLPIDYNVGLLAYEHSRLNHPPVKLTKAQIDSISSTIIGVCQYSNWKLHKLYVGTEHIHVVLTAAKPPEPVMNSLKSWGTRNMRKAGLWPHSYTPWSRHGSTVYLWNNGDIQSACIYVENQ